MNLIVVENAHFLFLLELSLYLKDMFSELYEIIITKLLLQGKVRRVV